MREEDSHQAVFTRTLVKERDKPHKAPVQLTAGVIDDVLWFGMSAQSVQ